MNDEKDVGNDKRFNVGSTHRTRRVPKGRLKQQAISTVPSGLAPSRPSVPTLKRWAILRYHSGMKLLADWSSFRGNVTLSEWVRALRAGFNQAK